MGRCVELADVRRWRMQLRSAFRSRSLGLHPDKTGLSTSDDFIELQEALALIQASHRRLAWRWCAQRTRPPVACRMTKSVLYTSSMAIACSRRRKSSRGTSAFGA